MVHEKSRVPDKSYGQAQADTSEGNQLKPVKAKGLAPCLPQLGYWSATLLTKRGCQAALTPTLGNSNSGLAAVGCKWLHARGRVGASYAFVPQYMH